jgi:hypothetical protein
MLRKAMWTGLNAGLGAVSTVAARRPSAPSGPQLERPKPTGSSSGPSPFLVLGAALATGYLLAKIVDWRGHAHPR